MSEIEEILFHKIECGHLRLRDGNLSIMNRGDSDPQGNDVSTRASLDRLCRWFEFVEKFGREPCFPEEVTYVEVGF